MARASNGFALRHALDSANFIVLVVRRHFVPAFGARTLLGQPSDCTVDVQQVSTRQANKSNAIDETIAADGALRGVVLELLPVHGEDTGMRQSRQGLFGSRRRVLLRRIVTSSGMEQGDCFQYVFVALSKNLGKVVGVVARRTLPSRGTATARAGRATLLGTSQSIVVLLSHQVEVGGKRGTRVRRRWPVVRCRCSRWGAREDSKAHSVLGEILILCAVLLGFDQRSFEEGPTRYHDFNSLMKNAPTSTSRCKWQACVLLAFGAIIFNVSSKSLT